MALSVGDFLPVRYNVAGELWHEREILAATRTPGCFAVLTPDLAVYVEDYNGRGVDVAAVRWSPVHRPSPPGLGGGRVYRFRAPPTGAAAAELRAAAADAAAERWEEPDQAALGPAPVGQKRRR